MADDVKKDLTEQTSNIPVTNQGDNSNIEDTDRENYKETVLQKYQPMVNSKETLITTAVHFLQNPKVKNVPVSQKCAFLLKKGLTNEDIDVALERVGTEMGQAMMEALPNPDRHGLMQYSPNYPGTVAVYQPPSLWLRWRELCSSVMVIGATCYGFYYFFKQYIEPLVIGKKRHEEDRMTKIERHLTELNRSLSQLRHSLISVESALTRHQDKGNGEVSVLGASSLQELGDLKTEVGSIKSLLLSRKQFPLAPPSSLSIPAWQRKQKDEEEEEDQTNRSESEDLTKDEIPIVKEAEDVVVNGIALNGELTSH